MSLGELQHYVPRFLLRRFAGSDGRRVHVFDKRRGSSFASNPDKLAAQKNYYDFEFGELEISLEKALGKLESRAAKHIARIIKDDCLHLDDSRERADLAAFFAVQLMRTPAQNATWRDCFSRLETWLRAQGAPDSFFAFEPLLHSTENARRAQHLKMIQSAPELLATYFAEKDWLLLSSDRGSTFLIGDHPITMHNSRASAPRRRLGVKVPGIELYCPLSPKLALAMHCPTSTHELAEAVFARTQRAWEQAAQDPAVGSRPWGPAIGLLQAVCVFRSWKAAIPTDAGPGFRKMPGRV